MVLKCEISKILLSNVKKNNFFRIFQNIRLKCSSLYTNLQNYSKTFISKSYSAKFLSKEGLSLRQLQQIVMGIKIYNKRICQDPQQTAKN